FRFSMPGDGDVVLYQVLDCLVVECYLAIAGKVLQVRFDDRCSLLCDSSHHDLLIVRHRIALDHRDRSLRTRTYAGPKPVAEKVADQPGFPFDQLERSFRAVRDALAASSTFPVFYADDLPFHGRSPAWDIIRSGYQASGGGSGVPVSARVRPDYPETIMDRDRKCLNLPGSFRKPPGSC